MRDLRSNGMDGRFRQQFLAVSTALMLAVPSPLRAEPCLTDAEIEAALGPQIRSGAPFVQAGALADRPLCSGLMLAQQIQRMREASFPEERAQRERAAQLAQAGRNRSRWRTKPHRRSKA